MCGIAGVYLHRSRGRDMEIGCVSEMIAAIRHRGPDGSGIWADPSGRVVLGHARLAIVDLTAEGAQPMISHSGRFALTFNGEIYNYVEMRRDLEKSGVVFHGTSDTEVLLEALDVWGVERAVERSRGMFAFALWDLHERCLWLARDRVGKKPLYYYEDSDAFIFASEIKGVLASSRATVSVSPNSLSDYLSLGFVSGDATIYREISEVPPGTILRLSSDGRDKKEIRYWEFPTHASNVFSKSEIEEEVEHRLIESIKLRLRADVPVGVFLSGGIDSGLITAIAAMQSGIPLNTFTVIFGSSEFDESLLARQVAERYGTKHREIMLNPNIEELVPRVVKAFDEPIADPSALPTFAISEEASKYVKVILNGEGADELFGGYRRIYAMKILGVLAPVMNRLPSGLMNRLLGALPHPSAFRGPYAFLHRFLRAAQTDPQTRYLLWSMDGFDEIEKERLILARSMPLIPTTQRLRDICRNYSALSPVAEFMALDFLVGMADCLLPKIDIATMAHGLEGRSPFLDQELVSWTAALDKRNLLDGRKTKPILRSIAKRYLPEELTLAPKRGFEIPLVRWMTDDLNTLVRDVCTSERSLLFDILDRKEVMAVLDRRDCSDDGRWAKRVWSLFMLASWGRFVYESRLH